MAHGFFQLQAPPAHIFQCISPDLDLCLFLKHASGLIFLLAVHIDLTGHDDGFRLLSRCGVALLHQQHIQTFFHDFFLPRRSSLRVLAQGCRHYFFQYDGGADACLFLQDLHISVFDIIIRQRNVQKRSLASDLI